MSQRLTQSQTHEGFRKLGAELDALKQRVDRISGGPVSTPGYQILGDGSMLVTGGLGLGGGDTIYEASVVPAPTGLSATWSASFDTVRIDLTWTAPSGLGADQVAGYVVQALKSGSSIPVEVWVSATSPSARIEPVEPNSTYAISVFSQTRTGRTSNAAVSSITTGADSTAPAAPTFPASPVLAAINGLAVKWNANTERDVANGAGQYRVVVSTNSALTSPVYDTRTNGTSLYIGTLTGGTAYYVGVYAIDSSGNSSPVAKPTGGPWTALVNLATVADGSITTTKIADNAITTPPAGSTICHCSESRD